MKKLFVLLVIVFGLLALKGYSQDKWKYIGENDDNVIYYDSESIKYNSNNTVTVYLRASYKYDLSLKTGIDFSISKNIIYCGENSYGLISITEFYKDGRINSFSYNPDEDREVIIPGGLMEVVYKQLCL